MQVTEDRGTCRGLALQWWWTTGRRRASALPTPAAGVVPQV